MWQDLCGTGLVSTIDDLDTLEADERKVILDELAAKFADSGFNLGLAKNSSTSTHSSGLAMLVGRQP